MQQIRRKSFVRAVIWKELLSSPQGASQSLDLVLVASCNRATCSIATGKWNHCTDILVHTAAGPIMSPGRTQMWEELTPGAFCFLQHVSSRDRDAPCFFFWNELVRFWIQSHTTFLFYSVYVFFIVCLLAFAHVVGHLMFNVAVFMKFRATSKSRLLVISVAVIMRSLLSLYTVNQI